MTETATHHKGGLGGQVAALLHEFAKGHLYSVLENDVIAKMFDDADAVHDAKKHEQQHSGQLRMYESNLRVAGGYTHQKRIHMQQLGYTPQEQQRSVGHVEAEYIGMVKKTGRKRNCFFHGSFTLRRTKRTIRMRI